MKNSIPGIRVTSETEAEVIVTAGAGEVWHDLVMWCIERNYAGLENLSLIPGLAGAAPIQNIGAYGAEQEDVFEALEAIEIGSGARVKFGNRDCAFGYRDSVFKHKLKNQLLVSAVSFRLIKIASLRGAHHYRTEYGDVRAMLETMKVQDLSLKAVSDAVCRIRRAKLPDPKELGNAGSFFKNPTVPQDLFKALTSAHPQMPHYPQPDGTVKIPAGWLIEQCGWKGRRVGNIGVHKDQALVLVNYDGPKNDPSKQSGDWGRPNYHSGKEMKSLGHATGQEILELSQAIRLSVRERFAIDLSPEVNVIC